MNIVIYTVILYTEVKSWKFVTVDIEGPFLGEFYFLIGAGGGRGLSITLMLLLPDAPYHNGTQDNCLDFVFVCGLPDSKDTAIEDMDPCPNEVRHREHGEFF